MMPHPAGYVQPSMIAVPYAGMIPGGMATRRRVTINGSVPANAIRFSINLQCGPNTNPRDDIALHLNFRFDAQVPYVARNHLQMQQWGTEEIHGYLTFNRGHSFEVHIDNEYDHYKIHVNGLHFTDFRHRLPVHTVTYLTVDGDVVITNIRFDGQSFVGTASVPLPPVMPGVTPYPMSNPVYPTVPHATSPYHATSSAIPVAMGAGLLAGAAMHGHANKKLMKKEKKMMKKAMKHHKPHKFHHHKHLHHGLHGFHRKSSSSSSSSD